jgi:hypothetical protein
MLLKFAPECVFRNSGLLLTVPVIKKTNPATTNIKPFRKELKKENKKTKKTGCFENG